MPRLPQLRVIIDTEPNTGRWNMAIDESLLNSAVLFNVATLRWYRWSEPTISLGYFQKTADIEGDPLLSPLPRVRRITGGGAILHDDEFTYSIALPSSQRLFQQPEELYDLVHISLARALSEMGYPVRCRGETIKQSEEPFLCFSRQDSHDITLNGRKIVGSAQRRRRGAILQHGSLIRRASNWAPHLPGLADLSQDDLPVDVVERLTSHVAEAIADSWIKATLTESEIKTAGGFCQHDTVNFR